MSEQQPTLKDYQETAKAVSDIAIKTHQFISGALDKKIKKMIFWLSILSGITFCIPYVNLVAPWIVQIYIFHKISKVSGVNFQSEKKGFLKAIVSALLVYLVTWLIIGLLLGHFFGTEEGELQISIPVCFVADFIAEYLICLLYIKGLKLCFKDRSQIDVNFKAGVKNITENKQDNLTKNVNSAMKTVNTAVDIAEKGKKLIGENSENEEDNENEENEEEVEEGNDKESEA